MNLFPFQSLFVFPNAISHHLVRHISDKRGHIAYRYLQASYTRNQAYEMRERDLRGQHAHHGWREPLHDPVEFTNQAADAAPIKRSTYAPLAFWAIIDVDNGEPTIEDGKVYVFAFRTRKEARDFRAEKIQRGACDIPQPVQLYQRRFS